ncbi:MAG: LysR family transcriptional regulator [Puniceicoccales bacterium]|jgi:DNA-binding transcriptional LysR family regulator|nr:LysR family transcriptional regulator [Puniceicoccales bacterium]
MEIRHLRYFIAVAEELNFRKAAERLHVSPPALSVQIKMLEEMLNVSLFTRDTKGVSLTIPGEVLLREARQLVQHAQGVIVAAQEAGNGKRGSLRIGSPGQLGYSFLPVCLETYQKRFPEIDVTLVDLGIELQHQHVEAINRGDIQIGFVYGQEAVKQTGMVCALVVDTPTRVVMGSHHPLASLRSVPLEKLAGQNLLAIGDAKKRLHIENILSVLKTRGIKPGNLKAISSFEPFIAMLAGGLGVSLLPDMHSLAMVDGIVVRPIKESGPDLRLQLYVIWKATDRSPLVRNFIEVLCGPGPYRT